MSTDPINDLFQEFEAFRAQRYTKGIEQYGELAFLDNDNIQELLEELADIANYAAFVYVQLRLLADRSKAGEHIDNTE
jgi:hypothetical protein